MLNNFIKYGGFIYFGLVFLSIVLTWGMNTTGGLWLSTFRLVGNNLLYVILAFGIGVSFFMENRLVILVILITNTVISMLTSISSFVFILRIHPEVLTPMNWLSFFLPLLLSMLTLVGYSLIKQRFGMILVIIVEAVSGIYAAITLFLISFVHNSSSEILIITAFGRTITVYLSVLVILFLIHYYYIPLKPRLEKTDSQEISFD